MNNDFSFLDSFSEETQDRLKRSILECSLLFHTDNSLVSGIKKDDILSKSIFALIVEADGNPTTNDIAKLYKVRFGKPIDTKVLDSVLMSLVRTSFISPNEGGYRPHRLWRGSCHPSCFQLLLEEERSDCDESLLP